MTTKAKSSKMLNWETQVKPILHKELDKYCGKDFVDALIEWTDDTAIQSIKLGYEQGKKDALIKVYNNWNVPTKTYVPHEDLRNECKRFEAWLKEELSK